MIFSQDDSSLFERLLIWFAQYPHNTPPEQRGDYSMYQTKYGAIESIRVSKMTIATWNTNVGLNWDTNCVNSFEHPTRCILTKTCQYNPFED